MPSATTIDRAFPSFHPTDQQRQGPAFARPHARDLKYALTEEQLDFFWMNGFISLPGLFTAEESQAFDQEAWRVYRDERVDEWNQRYEFAATQIAGEDQRVLWKIDPFHDLSPLFTDMVKDRRICDALASIYGGREPRLFKDKLIYKPPHTKGNALHQDYNWWQGYPTSLISVAIAIDAADEENGCTCVYPGYSKGFQHTPGEFAPLEREKIYEQAVTRNITQPGDVLMFHCFAPHEAGRNNTDAFRRQVFLTYNDAIDGEHYAEHYEHFRWYMQQYDQGKDVDKVYFR